MSLEITRRELLRSSGLLAAGSLFSGLPLREARARIASQTTQPAARKRVLRLAHLTDIHVLPERRGGEGLAACLRHVQSQTDRPDLILTGGDLVMDSFEADRARTQVQWDLFQKIFRAECSLPVEHCLGNHDIWGGHKKKSGATGGEPDYGKKWAMELLGLPGPYRSFDRAGWHVVILDSVSLHEDGYLGKLDAAQFEWLGADLDQTAPEKPVLVVSHIPILAACVLNDGQNKAERENGWKVSTSLMLVDGRRIRQLFAKHANVKLCLSGHIHLVDRVDYHGVSYVCDGAVSAGWWRGPHYECREGYGLIDLYDDGRWAHEYVTYGWQAEA